MTSRLDRISINPEIMHGAPIIRGMRFRVRDILDLLASDMFTTHSPTFAGSNIDWLALMTEISQLLIPRLVGALQVGEHWEMLDI